MCIDKRNVDELRKGFGHSTIMSERMEDVLELEVGKVMFCSSGIFSSRISGEWGKYSTSIVAKSTLNNKFLSYGLHT